MPTGVVEFRLDATTAVVSPAYGPDGAAGVAANLYDGDLTTGYHAGSTNSVAGIDLGAGNSAVLKKVQVTPRGDAFEHEERLIGAYFEASNDNSTWTSLWTSLFDTVNPAEPRQGPGYIPLCSAINDVPLANSTAYRYYRLHAASTSSGDINELRFLGTYSAGIAWRPAAPVLSPGGGITASPTVTIASPTTDATLYYTTDGTTPALSGGSPTGTTTPYTGPITLGSSASLQTINAIAYHASGSTTTSWVATGQFLYPAKFVPDAGVPSFSTHRAPMVRFDDEGHLVEAHGGDIRFDSLDQKYYWFGENTNTLGTSFNARGVWGYSSSDLYRWRWLGVIIPPPPSGWSIVNMERPHFLINAAPIDPNKRYVMWQHLDTSGYTAGYAGCATAPTASGPWTWQLHTNPGGLISRDSNVFQDPADGAAYLLSDTGNTHTAITLFRLDPATDWTSLDSGFTPLSIDTNGGREAPILFKRGAYYFLFASALSGYESGGTALQYKAATTLAGLAAQSWTTIWSTAPAAGTVPYDAQTTSFFAVNGKSDGYILACDWWDVGDTQMINSRHVWYPITAANFPTASTFSLDPAGSYVTGWDLSALPNAITATMRRGIGPLGSRSGSRQVAEWLK